MAVDWDKAHDEFSHLRTQEEQRNNEYHLLREAVAGRFRWPRNWPAHIPRVSYNLCKPVTERFAHYLIGRGFTYNVDRPNTLEFREAAERSEKILRRLFLLSKADLQFDMGARSGTQLGRTVFKVYKKGTAGEEHACFSYCQPDHFYGIPAGEDALAEWSVVYYSYIMDIAEVKRVFGEGNYKSTLDLGREWFYDEPRNRMFNADRLQERRIPILECWTKDSYGIEVGGVSKFNGDNPYGFVPFVVIENIRNSGSARGEADITQARVLNESYNQVISRKSHIVQRWLQPTVVWEGAPQNYGEILATSIAGGGGIPARIGSRLYFLSYDRPNPAVLELEQSLRAAILESAGMSEIALQGTVTGSVNTGPALAAQFQPVLTTIGKKQKEWEYGLKTLCRYLLDLQEQIGDSAALGQAVINETQKSEWGTDGEVVALSGFDIQGLREVTISWPGILPKDDIEASRLEMEKASMGFQSIYTTLEKLGEEYPSDEIARIRMENNDPSLRGEKVAEQMRAQAPLVSALANAEAQQAEAMAPPEGEELGPVAGESDLAMRLRELATRRPTLDEQGDEPVIGYPEPAEV